ncbi:MAG: T9SS type A sorting domain-containing protein [Rhodothermales bacterium]|nr:T9SS type A sorting domain-containing protein [Rhodothermales bacterium]MBO6780016.1 T9SS type A sorting domain-containing protein [Rhodothermales bacterium]
MRNATAWTLAGLLLAAAVPAQLSAQSTDLGAEFVFFVDGTNVLLPGYDGQTVDDPTDSSNKVAQFTYADWAAPGFQLNSTDAPQGGDMTAMVGETADSGKSLYLRMWVDPAFAGKALCPGADNSAFGTAPDDCLSLTFFDWSDGGAVENNREGRVKWYIPNWARNGEWHELAIPLPASNVAVHDSALVGKKVDGSALDTPLDSLAAYWDYAGGWSGETAGWGGTSGTPHGPNDDRWQDFEWDKVRGLTVHFDYNHGGAAVLLDNVYIGDSSTDISAAAGSPAAMGAVSMTASGSENLISWTHNPDFGGYKVYADLAPITQARIDAGELSAIATVPFNAAAFEVTHSIAVPHPSMAPLDVHYAVTSTSLFGAENTDVSASAGSVANADLPQQQVIYAMTDTDADLAFDNLAAGTVSDDGFPDGNAFVINQAHFKTAGGVPDDDTDLSASLKVAFDRIQGGTLWIYAEVTDEFFSFPTQSDPVEAGNGGWQYDSIEMGWGSYDVRDIQGGSILGGSPHTEYANGSEPDYQLRLVAMSDDGTNITGATTFFAADQPGSADFGVPVASGAAADVLVDGSGNTIGWKFLGAIPFESLAVTGLDHVAFALPADDEFKLVPFNIALNDADTAGPTRETQIQWSLKPNADGNWWQNPSQWTTVAVAGRATAVNTEDDVETPFTFSLDQNYPNPFNPATTISFSLAQTGKVQLSVYNVLGQQVATLVNGEIMSAGQHEVQFDASQLSSGMYLFRLDAGAEFSRTRSMMLIK